MKLKNILQDSHYSLDLFAKDSIDKLESRIKSKETKQGLVPYVTCLIRDKEIKLTPEEIVRQLYLDKLINEYGYKKENIDVEIGLQRGRDKYKPKQDDKENKDGKERVDILIYQNKSPYIVVEVKKPKEQDGKKQLESYLRYLNAPLGVLCNGDSVEEFYNNKEDTQYKTTKLEKLSDIPKAHQTLQEILEKKYTLKDLYINDELQTKNLKRIITDFEDVILANSGVDSFEEIFKLIFTKLYDEAESVEDNDEIFHKCKDKNFNNYPQMIEYLKDMDDKNFRILQFRNYGDDENFKKRLDTLFSQAKKKWRGIFDEDTNFELTIEELRISVSYLQDIKLFNSNLDVIDDAFEYLVTKKQKGDKGQYFTPRYVIDMCVKMLNPKPQETMIDTASGSCGFPMHCILYVWNKLHSHSSYLITNQKRTKAQKDYVENVFAIDFDEKSVRIGRLLNKIAGDGEMNVLRLNSLHFKQWKNEASVGKWDSIYQKGFENLEQLCRDSKKYNEKYAKDYKFFNFDIVMANPPFAGDITNQALYESYELGKNKISRDVLFIERNLNMLRPGGRMAIVLPQGRFNNSSDKYIREFIAQKARILAVIGLHQNVFKPHTGTKTSVLFLQKWGGVDEKSRELCPRLEDYNIFFATQNLPGKDNSGEKIYLKDKDSNYILDSHGHKIINHDLYNHEGLMQDGIAEAFIEFAKAENLSFWRE
ncbi:MAG: N-6 DNA methylase [Helicobacter sp.]|nr:N-6 DNA methylase [Helicobacter sp.]